MQEKAQALGLGLDQSRVPANVRDHCLTPCSDSYTNFLKGLYAKTHPRYYRAIKHTEFGNEVVDESVSYRLQKDTAYKPQNAGLELG
jgi:hypothetical protein